MTDAMSDAELNEHHAELLPARTALSLLQADAIGANGDPGTRGANGQSISRFTFFGIFGYGGPDPSSSASPNPSGGPS
jgi:hypothetical protein